MSNQARLLMTVLEAGDEAGVCRSVAYELASNGTWPTVRIGRSVRIPRDAFIEWIKKNTTQATAA